jgi:manganese/zinc/iron transport system permease protein
VLLLEDYNTRIVIAGTTVLGAAAGMVGSFTLLRKRALMGDALSHATLPGIALAFIVATVAGGNGKSMPVLLAGATVTGLVGVAAILAIRNLTRLKEDTALGAVLSVFFGAGVALLGVVQQMEEGHAAGLESFIYGKTASMGVADARLIGVAALASMATCLVLFKELKLLCFDEGFAGARGLPVLPLDLALMGLVVIVTIVGLQAVGLILMIALLVIPAAAARFWTDRLLAMFLISGGLGAAGGMSGAAVSALFSRLPSGAMIVLVCTAFFLASMVFGPSRGVLVRALRRLRLNRSVDRQHLLRAIYESIETSFNPEPAATASDSQLPESGPVSINDLLSRRSWSLPRLKRVIRRAARARLVEWSGNEVRLTQVGMREAARLTREHRLWELYLITYADIAPSRVDRDADAIEHVLEPEVIDRLESLLAGKYATIPASPHHLLVSR